MDSLAVSWNVTHSGPLLSRKLIFSSVNRAVLQFAHLLFGEQLMTILLGYRLKAKRYKPKGPGHRGKQDAV